VLIRLISIYVLIAAGTAFGQDPVVIKVGGEKNDSLEAKEDSIQILSYQLKFFSSLGKINTYARFNTPGGDTLSMDTYRINSGLALINNRDWGLTPLIEFGVGFPSSFGIPRKNYARKFEARLASSFSLGFLNFKSKNNTRDNSFQKNEIFRLELGFNRIYFQERLEISPKTYFFIGLNMNSFLEEIGVRRLKKVFCSFSFQYNFMKRPLAEYGLKNHVAVNIGVGYAFGKIRN